MGVNVAIVGATGMVGRTFLKVMEDRNFPVDKLYLFASSKSAGQKITFRGNEYIVEELTEESFKRDIQIALFSAGATISKQFAPIAASHGVVVIDNSSAWRMDENVPLVVPEKPLHDKYKIKRIVVSTYQAVSGAGKKGVDDLERSLKGEPCQVFPHPIANNCIPHIDSFAPNGYTKEELKMINETKKIMGDSSIKVSSTTVRVPVANSHSESVNVEFARPYEMEELIEVLKHAPGVVVQDDPQNNIYPLATYATGKDEVFVGRIRRDETVYSGVNMWIVADNIRKGAATNAVQIAELLIKNM
jgi:aspartate-semialdehyde dehydrogenase